jgi:hypothetical protein
MATTDKLRPITLKQQKRMKISHINTIQNPKFIIVRHYDNSIVTLPSNFRVVEQDAIGCWRVRIIEIIPKEYKQSNNLIWQEDQKKE